jgi:hypothetical protein
LQIPGRIEKRDFVIADDKGVTGRWLVIADAKGVSARIACRKEVASPAFHVLAPGETIP